MGSDFNELQSGMRNRRLPPQFNSVLLSSGLLRGVRWFETDFSGLPIGSIFKGKYIQLLPRHHNP
jgi:hypothetical protein